MDTINKIKAGHSAVNDFALLIDAINRWDRFLDRVFVIPGTGYISADELSQMSLEDTEHYLDVKIQLSQCIRTLEGAVPEKKFEDICGGIRKATYQHISATLRNLSDNRRSLIELAHKDDHPFAESSVSAVAWMPSADLEMSLEYKDCLVQERNQLKSDVIRQRSKAKSLIVRLLQEVRTNFYARPGNQ